MMQHCVEKSRRDRPDVVALFYYNRTGVGKVFIRRATCGNVEHITLL